MNEDRTVRGAALLIALGVQALTVLIVGLGMRTVPERPEAAPAMTVSLLPEVRRVPDPPASMPKAPVHLQDPGIPVPEVPVDIVLSPVPQPQPSPDPATVVRTTNQESAGSTIGTESRIRIVSRVEPDYPQAAVDRRAQGTTLVAILVEANGHPGAVRVLHSSGDPQLDAAAVRAVQKWEFTPEVSNSHVVASWGQLEVNFNLAVFRQQHPDMQGGSRSVDQDPVSRLGAVINSWSGRAGGRTREIRDQRSLELLSPALRRILQKSGPVRSIRFLGVASRPPDGVAHSDPQQLRVLNASGLTGWDLFEVTQTRGKSHWYCAVDTTGQIRDILTSND